METMTAAEAKQKFGQLLDKAQRGPVQITKNGRPSVYLISAEDFEEAQRWEQFLFERKLERASEQIERGETIPADVVFRELREKYLNKENLDAAE